MRTLWNRYRDIPLLKKMFVAMLAGIVVGIILGPKAEVMAPLGTLFLQLLQMIALPLIIVNLLSGLCSLDDPKLFGRIGVRVLLYYCLTTVFAMVIAVAVGWLIRPGLGFILSGDFVLNSKATPSIGATILSMIPSNVFTALSDGKFDQVVIFVAIFGMATLFLPAADRERIRSMSDIFVRAFNKIMGAVMLYAPIGIFALMARTFGRYGLSMGGPIAKYVVSVYISVALMFCVYLLLLYVFVRMKPGYFLRRSGPVIVSAASTCSSIATLPVNLKAADDLGVPKGVYSFTIPLGNQLNRDGMGIFFAMSFMFTAQAAGVDFTLAELGKMILLSLLLTLGGGGIPGGAMVFLALIFETFGLPVEVVAVIAGIHTINEMGLTTMNCLGDLVGTVIATFSGQDRKNLPPEATN